MEEWDDDICCATCKYGEPEEECIYCSIKAEHMPTDGVCEDHEY